MKKENSMKELLLIKKLKAEDPVGLPMDEAFFDRMHNNIMQAVEKTEIKPVSKWSKTWVFLEREAKGRRHILKKAVKIGISAVSIWAGAMTFGLGMTLIEKTEWTTLEQKNQEQILTEVKKDPTEWTEMSVIYQDDADFYAEVISQRPETLVEVDQIIAKSL